MNRIGRMARWSTALSALTLATILSGAGAASAGQSWTVQPFPVRHGTREAEFAVSCHRASFCFSVGTTTPVGWGNGLNSYKWTGISWEREHMIPVSGTAVLFAGVSCPSKPHCMAVGSYRPEPDALPLAVAEYWTGAHWKLLPVPVPTGHQWTTFNAVSCLSATWCTAVGSQSSSPTALVEVWKGTTWTLVPTPQEGKSGDDLNSVSCVSENFCVAVGESYRGESGRPLMETWNGTSWVVQHTPVPSGLQNGAGDGVSCASATACTAVVSYRTAAGRAAQILRWNGTAWKVQPSPAGIRDLNGVSCPTSTSCTAVGEASGATVAPVVAGWNGSGWAVEPAALSSGQLMSVSCPSAAFCMSAGYRDHANRPQSEDD
jgi:hypothetical protein